MIAAGGYETAFLHFGLGQGIIVCMISWFLQAPRAGEADVEGQLTVEQSRRHYTPLEMLCTPIFWIMYLIFVLVGAGGLMATAQLAPIAKDFNVDTVPVSLLGITLPALIFALSLDRVLNGLTRPFFGWVSDKLGRENTMFIAFSLEALGIWLLSMFGESPVTFVLLSGLVFFAWGEIYSLFPSTCTDAYGTRYATTNAGLFYTAKGHRRASRTLGQCADHHDRQLARRVHYRHNNECNCRSVRNFRIEADAGASCSGQQACSALKWGGQLDFNVPSTGL